MADGREKSWLNFGRLGLGLVLLRFQNVSCRSVSVGFSEKNLCFRFGLGFHDKCVVNFFMTRVIWHDFHHR